LRARRFRPWLYWWVILSTSTAGTTISNDMDRGLGLGDAQGTLILGGCLAATLGRWWR
jgi:uncharacterized membrane-anchored protein